VYFLKAVALLFACSITLSVIESFHNVHLDAILFEVFSAFGTVGLTLGLTTELSVLGKIVIIATMFAGRVGLIALAFPATRHKIHDITYPEGHIILG
jgi:trk system potassium uptake protein TrkH